jgi:dipeptidyl aminopeptidase/acylaminoacyl peptidase
MRRLSLSFALALFPAALPAQSAASQPSGFDFSIANLMRGPELYGRAPSAARWSADGRWIYFQWNEAGTDWREPLRPYRVRAEAGAMPERLTLAESDSAAPYYADGLVSPDGGTRVVEANGDIYVVSLRDGSARRLTQTVTAESQPSWSADGRTVYFMRDNNAFAITLADGFTRQLTDIHTGPAPVDSAARKGQRGALERQQRELFDAVRDKLAADSVAKAERKAREAAGLQPVYISEKERVSSISVSPNGRAALVVITLPGADSRQTEVPQFVTTSGYVENLKLRTKVGDATGKQRALLLSLPNGKATPLGLFGADSSGTIALAGWNDDGSNAALFVYPANHKSRRLVTLRSTDTTLTTVETLRDSAWVGGPCSSCAGWYDGGRRLWYVSEASGYAQLYSAASVGGDVRPLTQGKWEVLAVALSPDRRDFYLTTSELSAFEQQLYRMSVNGGTRTRVTNLSGGHSAVLSPDGRWLADVYSFVNRPPELYLASNGTSAPAIRLTTSPSPDYLAATWLAPALVQIPASDGIAVPAHIYRPEDMGAQPNGAAVIFVHGAGYLHNVGNFWSQYPREYLFNQFLAKHGYVVLDLDYRASAGYGRDWRTAIYRWMGGRDLQDQVDASTWLTKTYGIPTTRVGMYGGSYGGFMTLMALFTQPDHFGAGAALRSVTDWAHYNEGYTSAILNHPQDDSVAYRRSSPIYFASGLKAPLLMAHGMVDQNVEYQDIVRLEQRLIELGKTNWTLASYPVEDHGFVRPSSWTDEYRRIFELFESTIAHPAGATRATGADSAAPR